MNPVSQTPPVTSATGSPNGHSVSTPASSTPVSTQLLYAPIEAEMRAVEARLSEELGSNAPFVNELLQYVSGLGGKRLRPALMLLMGKATGRLCGAHITLAAVMEMIHVATLVHDDVLDDAATRRHLATVNSRWGTQASVLLGDYLFTHAFYLASTTESTYACRTIGRSTNRVCEGELRQVGNQGNWRLTEAEYFEIIGGKTADLCACCCELGAHYAGADTNLVGEMRAFGYELGIAFQIADDVLDLNGDEAKTGKSLGSDLVNQKATLPVIRFLATTEDRERYIEQLSDPTWSAAAQARFIAELNASGAMNEARARALEFSQAAAARLEPLPPSAARDILQAITAFVVHRLH